MRRTVRALEVAEVTGRPFSSFAATWERYPNDGVRAAGVRMDPSILRDRIERRVRAQFEGGFLEEVRALMERGMGPSLTARQAIGYAEAIEHLERASTLEDAVARTERRTRALARRQLVWFRRDPRIKWFDAGAEGAPSILGELLEYFAHG